ncbi:hypothetical protein BD410DRAFT_720445 [Rickenella mellea]|uniref:Uncharacterized protein n=1 Tax=Rickenella mellea TaxID=50990 RepID=A0A4Y7Q7K7_9AGAM|nr:hypothetical protein BD410DRAFT_720445 [Rickenella mellea]
MPQGSHISSADSNSSIPQDVSLASVASASATQDGSETSDPPPLRVSIDDSRPPSDLNKAVPPPPPPDSDSDDELHDLYMPGLIVPTMFLPIPNTDPLTTLLSKYVSEPHIRPPRDLSGDWHHADLHTLVMTNSWRAIAKMARDRIVSTNPGEVNLILSLWYLRLSSLSRLRLFNQTAAECNNLFAVLSTIDPPQLRAHVFDKVLPFELEVMRARCVYWAGDHMGYLDTLSALLRRCKLNARKAADDSEASMWKERGARMCLIIASQLVEMKDFAAATSLLESLCASSPSAQLHSAIARIYLQGGHIAMASRHISIVEANPDAEPALKYTNASILAAANGDWDKVSKYTRQVLESDSDNVVAINNLAVALLSQGKLREGIEVLETALVASPSAVTVAEPFLFNISTLYELRSALALNKKRSLLIEVAKWSGDGLKTTCLKMSSS